MQIIPILKDNSLMNDPLVWILFLIFDYGLEILFSATGLSEQKLWKKLKALSSDTAFSKES